MNDHPLGDINGTDASSPVAEPSIVDQILDLDRLLSADVRRAEKTARFCLKPYLEADVDELESELSDLVDTNGNPITTGEDESLGDTGCRTARQVAAELQAKRREMAAAMVSVRMQAMAEEAWGAFTEKYKKDIQGNELKPAMFHELIVACAVKPKITVAQLLEIRRKLGHPQVDALATAAWNVNTKSGVSIPKSPLSSAVLRRAAQD